MLSDIASGCEVYLVTGYTDMRKGIDGLATIVQGKLLLDSFKRTRDEIFKDLPVEEVIHKADTACPECQSEMKVIGKEYICEELVYVPSKIYIRKHYAEVVKCPECGEYTDKSVSEKAVIIKGKVPKSVLPKSYCSPELLAHIFYEKYAKAVPLERLAKDFKNMKAEISTATLANWVIEASETYLKPIYQQLHSEILKKKVIHADETVVLLSGK